MTNGSNTDGRLTMWGVGKIVVVKPATISLSHRKEVAEALKHYNENAMPLSTHKKRNKGYWETTITLIKKEEGRGQEIRHRVYTAIRMRKNAYDSRAA